MRSCIPGPKSLHVLVERLTLDPFQEACLCKDHLTFSSMHSHSSHSSLCAGSVFAAIVVLHHWLAELGCGLSSIFEYLEEHAFDTRGPETSARLVEKLAEIEYALAMGASEPMQTYRLVGIWKSTR